MAFCYFSSVTGDISGKASYAFKEKSMADAVVEKQNKKAEAAGLSVRYVVGKCNTYDLRGNETPR